MTTEPGRHRRPGRRFVIIIAVIAAACIAILVGLRVYNNVTSGVATNGKLAGKERDNFVAATIKSCEERFPAQYTREAAQSYCTCMANASADVVSEDELKSLLVTGQIPDSLARKLQEPLKECTKSAGLAPAR